MTASRVERGAPVTVAGTAVPPGKRRRIDIPVARLPTGTWLHLPVSVVNGRGEGPMIWLSSAIHGDELNGIEIIRRVMKSLDPKTLKGAVIAVPIVNVFGFIGESRYLPDRRDLNRSFPGSARGSLAARLANLFIREIAVPCGYGLDLHTGSNHRINMPQIRADLDEPETRRIAEAFGAPVMIHARLRDGSLREAASRDGTHVLVYEGGEPQRFNDDAIAVGVDGTFRVMTALGMLAGAEAPRAPEPSIESRATTWVRARRAGILRLDVGLGDRVATGDVLGVISDAFGEDRVRVRAPVTGMVIGHSVNPLATQGDGVIHLAELGV